MRVVFDMEADKLINPSKIWVIVCQDIDSNEFHIFREVTENEAERQRFNTFAKSVSLWIGHNWLGWDYPVLNRLLGLVVDDVGKSVRDTLILSKLIDYPRDKHSIKDYGIEFNLFKGDFTDWSQYSVEMEEYCIRDVQIGRKVYEKYRRYIDNPTHLKAIGIENYFQLICNTMSTNGFSFNLKKAEALLLKVQGELTILDKDILSSFLPKLKLIREVTPKETKYGTISLSSIPRAMRGDIAELSVGASFSYCSWVDFNPSSHKQIIQVLNDAKWDPVEKTKTHVEYERDLNKLKYRKPRTTELDLETRRVYDRLVELKKTGWKVSEENLDTLPLGAPAPAKTLAKRILLESRRRTLTEWINLVCLEIKINKKSIEHCGLEKNVRQTQLGEKESKNIITNDVKEKIWKNSADLTSKNLDILNKKNASEDTISKVVTDLRSKTLIEWLKSKKVNVEFASENESYLWITATPQAKSVVSCAVAVTQLLAGLKQTGLQYEITSERIKGEFFGLGAWTHRMAHQKPNTANIPNEFDTNNKKKLYGKELRSLWQAPKNRLLVGVDAEGIQLRIFAHYVNNPELTEALVNGKKSDKTDPHSYNQRVLGDVCKSRQAAKRFLYALFLGAGVDKLASILGCNRQEAEAALERLLAEYPGFQELKSTIIPSDARRGWFTGLDGRSVRILGDTVGTRKHLAMSGYLQNGEAVIMKHATVKWHPFQSEDDAKLVDLVHDEWQNETPNNMETALRVAKRMSDSLREVGEELGLRCPLAGSYWNDDHNDYTIGTNWSVTH